MTHADRFGRRSLLKRGGAAVIGATLAPASAPAQQAAPPSPPQGVEIYRSQWVPSGAVGRVAYVTDHHYWPRHQENWGGGAQITSSSDRRMPDLDNLLNAINPDVSIHG